MRSKKSWNPISFTAVPVTVITVAVYIALAAGLLYVHLTVPDAPENPVPFKGVNLTEAWRDLQTLTGHFHPYNSHSNDVVHKWLLTRVNEILRENGVPGGDRANESRVIERQKYQVAAPAVTVFDDKVSNVTLYPTSPSSPGVYFEGTNIMVYIRGSQDGETDWWRDPDAAREGNKRGVLVNAHYDSVSTGYGATDNGVGVITTLQLIKYFSTSGNQPIRGFVALFNNGEEDFLNGAYAFMQHPLSRFPDTFLNLEGAGAGGRTILLRSTDAEVTESYKKSPQPFGSVIAADAFNRGVVRSQTDYIVLNGKLGLRGLDVTFYEPRARYHTEQDSARWTSKASVWNMLSTAVATTKALTSDTDSDFGEGTGSRGIWFDLLGSTFALLKLHTLFAISTALLIVSPIVMIALVAILGRVDRYYLFARKTRSDPLDPRSPDEETIIQLNGWRGLFRYPIAIILATAAVAGLVLLVTKINPFLVYSSPFAVWSMMLSAWFVVAWFFLRGADFMRPTALHRAHAFGWLFVLGWLVLVVATIGENNFQIASGYFAVIYFAAIFLALLITYLEMFGLPKKADYVRLAARSTVQSRPISSNHRAASIRSSQVYEPNDGAESSSRTRDSAEEPSESTSLLGRKRNRSTRYHDDEEEDEDDEPLPRGKTYGDEQAWSATLPSWLWLLEFLIVGPIPIILVGEIGLFGILAGYQTPADGTSSLTIYVFTGIVSVLLMIPVSPFLHRFTSRVPTLVFLIFLGTLIYSLLAFPFSPENRLKLFFSQDIDLASGITRVTLTGLDGYVQDAIGSIPSAAGQRVNCTTEESVRQKGLIQCRWNGLTPNVIPGNSIYGRSHLQPRQTQYRTWVSVNTTRLNTTENEAIFRIIGRNTRACKLLFNSPISDYSIDGGAPPNDRLPKSPEGGLSEIRLWHREWEKPWTVRVKWDDDVKKGKSKDAGRKQLEGRAVCLWSDANERGTIPALDELKHYLPAWVAVTKRGDGLVEGYKSFKL